MSLTLGKGMVGRTLAAGAAAFDPLSVGTPLLWIDAANGVTHTGDGTPVTAIADQAAGTMTVTVPGAKRPTYDLADANYNNAPTIDCGTAQGIELTTTGLTTTAFTLVMVANGVDNAWMQDGNGNYLVYAGAGTGNDLGITANAATYLATSGNESGVAGVYIFVFNGASSKIYASALTAAASGDAGALADLTGLTVTLGGPSGLVGVGLMGSIRHAMIYSGALSNADCGYLLTGFGAESVITIGA